VTGAFGDGVDVSFVRCGRGATNAGWWVRCHGRILSESSEI
jgi:hypothetical protein